MDKQRPIDLEAEYNNRARVPEYPDIMAGWERDAAAYRAGRAERSELGLRYGTHPRQAIDIFWPDVAEDGRPLVLFIHGGYWRSLEPSLFSHLAAGANVRGLTVALPGYRLCPEATVAEAIEDVRAACLFLYRRLGRPIVACGHSAGGHLAAAMAATEWGRCGDGAPADLVRRALAISGLFDLTPLLATSVNETLRLDEAAARAASPAFWPVPAGITLEAWAGGDESAEYLRQSRMITERWGAAGATARYRVLPGLNHFTAPAPLAEADSGPTMALAGLCDVAS